MANIKPRLDDYDLLHVEASEYANRVAAESIAFRKKNRAAPYDMYATPALFLVRYESYKAGVLAERARRPGELHARSLHAGGRREGRTFAMIKALTPDVRYIVVHTAQMKDYVERMLRDVRRDLTRNSVRQPRVLVVQSTRDCEPLRGSSFVVDHACLEHASPELHAMLRTAERRQ